MKLLVSWSTHELIRQSTFWSLYFVVIINENLYTNAINSDSKSLNISNYFLRVANSFWKTFLILSYCQKHKLIECMIKTFVLWPSKIFNFDFWKKKNFYFIFFISGKLPAAMQTAGGLTRLDFCLFVFSLSLHSVFLFLSNLCRLLRSWTNCD